MTRDRHPDTGIARSGEGPDRAADAALDAALDALRAPAPSETLTARLKRLPLPVACPPEHGAGPPSQGRNSWHGPWRHAAVAAALVLAAAIGVLVPARGPEPMAPSPVAGAVAGSDSGFTAVSDIAAEPGFEGADDGRLPAVLTLVGGPAAADGFELPLLRANAPAGESAGEGFGGPLEAIPLN